MPRLVIAAPVLPNMEEAWRRLCQELTGRRRREFEIAQQRLGAAAEAIWLLHTADIPVAVITVDAGQPEQLLARLALSEQPFDCWFKERIRRIFGLELTPALLGPTMELIVNWTQEKASE